MTELISTGHTYDEGRRRLNALLTGSTSTLLTSGLTFENLIVNDSLSASTFYSGSTNLASIFAPISGASPLSGNSNTGSIVPISGSNISNGTFSFIAGGQNNRASGSFSHAEGVQTSATTNAAHAEGAFTLASGIFSHAEGFGSIASGPQSHAEGYATIASGGAYSSHAEGYGTIASGQYSHSQGRSTLASGAGSHASGFASTASGNISFIHSLNSNAIADYSAILGGQQNRINIAATRSIILGGQNITGNTADTVYVPNLTASTNVYAQNFYSGSTNLTSIFAPISGASPLSGNSNTGSIVPISGSNISNGTFSFVAGGTNNIASGNASHAQGANTMATGAYSHAEGASTLASATLSHAQGYQTSAVTDYAHSEGSGTLASGIASHAEGTGTLATGTASHAEGSGTIAVGIASHSSGFLSTASGDTSFAHSFNSIVYAHRSAILGGRDNIINYLATGSTILGGNGITGTSAHTVYVPSLVIATPDQSPFSSGSTGTKGTVTYDPVYFYICYETDSWGRIPFDTVF